MSRMKPIKLIVDEGCDYVKVGMVLNEFLEELENPESLKEGKDDYEVQVGLDFYLVEVDNQQRQIKVRVKSKKTFDEVVEEVMIH